MEDSNSPFNGSPSNNVRQFLAKKSAEFNDLRRIVWGQDSSLTVVFRPNMTQPIEGQKNWHRGWISSGIQLGSMILHVLSMIRICNPPLFLWTFWVKGFQLNLKVRSQKNEILTHINKHNKPCLHTIFQHFQIMPLRWDKQLRDLNWC